MSGTVGVTRFAMVVLAGFATSGCNRVTWQGFTAPERTFSVSFPATPESKQVPDGVTYRAAKSDVAFVVTVVQVQPSGEQEPSAETVFDKVQADAAAQFRVDPQDVRPVVAGPNAHPGREFVLHILTKKGPATMKNRVYRSRAHLFIVNTVAPAGDGFDLSPFWDSFTILE